MSVEVKIVKLCLNETNLTSLTSEQFFTALSNDASAFNGDINQASLYTRDARAKWRVLILPKIHDAKRRFDAGETINGCRSMGQLSNAIGLNYSTVRTWLQLEKHALNEARFQVVLSDIRTNVYAKCDADNGHVIGTTAAMMAEAPSLEPDYEDEWGELLAGEARVEGELVDVVAQADEMKDLTNGHEDVLFPAAVAHKKATSTARSTARARVKRIHPTSQILNDATSIVTTGFKTKASTGHPDTGGTHKRMVRLNAAHAWLCQQIALQSMKVSA